MQKSWRNATLLAYSLAILAFLYLPLLILSLYSFNDSRINAVWTGFTLKWYVSLLQNDRVLEALERAARGRTVLSISHRFSRMMAGQRIVRMG